MFLFILQMTNDRQTDRQTNKVIQKDSDSIPENVKVEKEQLGVRVHERDSERQKDRKTERQKDRKTERQKDRKTERQIDRKTER